MSKLIFTHRLNYNDQYKNCMDWANEGVSIFISADSNTSARCHTETPINAALEK